MNPPDPAYYTWATYETAQAWNDHFDEHPIPGYLLRAEPDQATPEGIIVTIRAYHRNRIIEARHRVSIIAVDHGPPELRRLVTEELVIELNRKFIIPQKEAP